MAAPADVSLTLIELGSIIVGLALLARVASKIGLSGIPLYLLAGLAFGKGGIAPLELSQDFIRLGAEIGVLLLLFMLGLEYTPAELKSSLREGLPSGIADFILNFTPGVLTGVALRWNPMAAVLLGGVTYCSSSGIVAKVLGELRRLEKPETPGILSILVMEDLAMAVYLPLVGALMVGGSTRQIVISIVVAVAVVSFVLFVALRFGDTLSRLAEHESDEVVLLTTFGTVLLVAGVAQKFQVSAAIGAFLVGIALSGPIAKHSERLLSPLRDLFAVTFFFFFGLEVDPSTLPKVLPIAATLAVVTALTKVATGYWSAKRARIEGAGRMRAGVALIPRGEFSMVIAGLGIALEPALAPLSAAYVLLLAIAGPVAARVVK
jgi:monovalent cation:H+ antiporter-2, CPA2 family